ncbi:MAG: hypothetical protein ACI9KK_003233 [Ascidiaceihabitans sp.]|jgi:hypothetical protein
MIKWQTLRCQIIQTQLSAWHWAYRHPFFALVAIGATGMLVFVHLIFGGIMFVTHNLEIKYGLTVLFQLFEALVFFSAAFFFARRYFAFSGLFFFGENRFISTRIKTLTARQVEYSK